MSKTIKVLNLYACLGGNRYKWTDCEVTAVEIDPELAQLYKLRFPNDTVIIGDAHQYLLDHYKEYDFIWTSPPCPTHSRARFWGCKNGESATKPVFPDMKLYEEIIFLENYYKGKYCVENVIPYYNPLISAKKRGRHLYWTNFNLPSVLSNRKDIGDRNNDELIRLSAFHNYDFTKYKGEQSKIKIARNMVNYEAGKTIFNTAKQLINHKEPKLIGLFDSL